MGVLLKTLKKLNNMGNPPVKDFTEQAEEEMIEIVKDVDDSDDLFAKYVTDPVGRWLDKKGYLELLYGVKRYQEGVIDCYNYSAENITKICEQARHYDKYYGQSIAHRANQSDNVAFLVKNLAECLDVKSKRYSPDVPVSKRIMGYFGEEIDGRKVAVVAGDADRRYENDLADINIEENDIIEWSFDSDSVTLFEDYTDYIFEKEMDWGALDIVFLSTGRVVYKGIEMTVDELLSALTKEGYSEKLVRQELNSIISSVISTNNNAQTFMKEHDVAKENIEAKIKNYLDDEDIDTKFKSFVEKMGGIDAVKELAEKCPELVDYLFSDYSNGLEIINNLSKTVDNSGTAEMRLAVERLKQEYESKWKGVLHKTKDFSGDMIEKLSDKAIKDWIKDEVGDTYILFSVLEITGLEDKVDGADKLVALKTVVNGLQDSYEETIEKIKSGSYSEEDIKYAQNLFDMLKEATKSVYETFRDMTGDASKKIWANEQIENIENMNMKNYYMYKFKA